jgi:xanthine dehydrogenase YagR molybdenum-binding subunit
MITNYVGRPTRRVDGRAKVTGAAKYAGEYNVPKLAYGYVVSSAVAKGRIKQIDTHAALGVEGVLRVLTHENRPELPSDDSKYDDEVSSPGSPFRPLYDDKIKFSGQPIALVVAEEFEIARHAASLVRVEYELEPHVTDLKAQRAKAYVPQKERPGIPSAPPPRGNPEKALADAAARHDAEYSIAFEHHNPMEMYATTAVWESDDRLTIYDKTQGPKNNQSYVANVFGLPKENVRLVTAYMGGGFGSGLRPQYQLPLAVMAAQQLKRPVRVTLTRQQMFSLGYRPEAIQRVALGASRDGELKSILHDALANTSQFEDFQEGIAQWSGMLYKCDNTQFSYKLAKLDLNTPIDMRAPGGVTGIYAIECAMDELAVKLGIDPVELRLKNYTDKDQNENIPFSSKELRECYRQGAEKFGWSRRNPKPRSMREGNQLIGWGMATGAWEAMQFEASAQAVLTVDGKLDVGSATADIGTGTYTIMTQLAADALGLAMEDVTFRLGDSSLPQAPVEGGSFTAATVGSAVHVVCEKVQRRLFELAQKAEGSPLAKAKFEDVVFTGGQMRSKSDPSRAISIPDVMRKAGVNRIEEHATSTPDEKKHEKYARYTHSAIFVEVRVDEDLGIIRVPRVVNAVAAGRILNPKTARSQVLGGVVWGIGMALEEETVLDHRFGRFMTHNLADYHVPVNADVHDIDVIFVEEHDSIVNPIGVKGLGEIGIIGTPAAIANAIYHATGKRVRDLPITLDKLL